MPIHSPPLRMKRAARMAPEAARGTALGKTEYSGSRAIAQGGARCIPKGLICLVYLHRLYRPSDPLPADLQRAIASAWTRGTK
jgi:hypothetical protein